MNKALALAALTTMVAASATTVLAQETKPIGLTARVGVFFPTQDNAKNAGKQWFAGGVEYKLGDLKLPNMSTDYAAYYTVSVDLYSKGDFRHVPVLLNYVGRLQEGIYYFAGAGVGFEREPIVGGKKNNTAFSYQAGAGYEFTKSSLPLFVEAKYVGCSKSSVNGFGVFVGARF